MQARLILAVAAMLVAGSSLAQNWPTRAVRVIPGQPGGGGYVQMLAIKDLLGNRLGHPFIMDARPANLMGGLTSRAEPDGHTLMIAGNTVWFLPILEKTDYDTLKDLKAIGTLGTSPSVLVVNPSLPVKSVKELVAYAKSKPGALNYSSAATGSSYHIAAELFKTMAGLDIVRVNYTGAGPTIQAVLAGEVQMSFGTSASVATLIRAGKLRALAHTGLKPSALVPDLPSMVESGFPGFQVTSTNAIFVPVKTPTAIARKINQEFNWALAQPGVRDMFLKQGAEPNTSTPEEAAKEVAAAYAEVAKLVKSAGITSQ